MVSISTAGGEISLELEEYLIGVLAGEMPAVFEMEALKAQAVASRTYVLARGLKVDDTTSSQVYQNQDILKEKWKDSYEQNLKKIKDAIRQTQGQIMTYQNEIIHAFFFSSCNGKTNNSEDYWTTPYPYLISVESPYDSIKKDNERQKSISIQEMNEIFKEEVFQVEVLERYENNYVKIVKVNQTLYSGKDIREKCGLSSSSFTVQKNEEGFLFITLGSGHGVGMSQYGAQGMALAGYDYVEILKHYYTGVEIVNK